METKKMSSRLGSEKVNQNRKTLMKRNKGKGSGYKIILHIVVIVC
jgi:hypothetical protein